jgi:hypothetical protein
VTPLPDACDVCGHLLAGHALDRPQVCLRCPGTVCGWQHAPTFIVVWVDPVIQHEHPDLARYAHRRWQYRPPAAYGNALVLEGAQEWVAVATDRVEIREDGMVAQVYEMRA